MSRNKEDGPEAAQEPTRVATRDEFDEAVEELFRTGRPIEAPSLQALAGWDMDIEDDEGAIEGKPFKWTKTADEILAKVKRFGQTLRQPPQATDDPAWDASATSVRIAATTCVQM